MVNASLSTVSSVQLLRPRVDDRADDKLSALPAVLLRELQHRTANMLQLASLQLEVQLRRTGEASSRAALQTIASSFQSLIQAQKHFVISDFRAVADAATEVRDASVALANGYAEMRPGICVDCIVDRNARFTVRPAGVLSLIIHELVTNAFKYAFRGRSSGYLLVSLAPAGTDKACLSVIDDGPGFELPASRCGTGLGIVRSLAEAIDGEVSVGGTSGTEGKVRVTFATA